MRRPLRLTAVIALVAIGIAAPASAWGAEASAAQRSAGLWYFDAFGVQDAIDAGHDGSGVTVAIIEGQIDTAAPELAGTDVTVIANTQCLTGDSSTVAPTDLPNASSSTAHATEQAAYYVGTGDDGQGGTSVRGVSPGAAVRFYSAFTSSPASEICNVGAATDADSRTQPQADAIIAAVEDGASIISLSFGSPLTHPFEKAIAYAVAHDVVVLSGRPNSTDLCVSGGAALELCGARGVVAVGSMDSTGAMSQRGLVADAATTVVGPGVDVLGLQARTDLVGHPQPAIVQGSSSATAIIAGFLADVKSAYPDATGNQLIQTLIHNTGTGDHPLQKDSRGYSGYGIVSLTHMLAVDPTQYPDENPLLDKSSSPTDAEFAAAGATSSATDPTTGSPASSAGLPVWAVPAIVVGALVVLAIVVIAIVLGARASRRRGAGRPGAGPPGPAPAS